MDQLVLMTEVNLSHNQLSCLDECNMLACVKTLNASNNNLRHITKRHALRLGSLQELSLANNSILFEIMKIYNITLILIAHKLTDEVA